MSHQPKQTTEYKRVCDLCDKSIDEYGHRDWSALNVGHPGAREPGNPVKRAFRFMRKRHGERGSGAPKGDYRSWEWDFHGECLVRALNPLIVTDAKRRDMEGDDDDQ